MITLLFSFTATLNNNEQSQEMKIVSSSENHMEKINCPLKKVINVWTNFSQIFLLQLFNEHMVIYNVSYTCSISKISYKHA